MNKKLPYLEVSGTHREVGLILGKTFKENIQKAIKKRRDEIPNYDRYLPQVKECFDITKKHLPNLIEEVEAISESAEVPVLEYFFINNREVYDSAEEWDRKQASNPNHCTVAVGFGKEGVVVGHNEDWSQDAIDDLYILKAKINDVVFMGLNYNDAIAGLSASMNNYGLVQCVTDLYQTNKIGVPKNFLARAVLECKTIEEAENLIRNIPKGSGFNHVLIQGNEIRNIEIAGKEIAVQRVINKPFVHTNHYLSLELRGLEKFHTKSSEARYIRAQELLKNVMEKQDIIRLLSDTQNKEFPICREDETIGAAVFVPNKREANFCYGHPCGSKFITYFI